MPTPISRPILEQTYERSLAPFLGGLTKMIQTFDYMFKVIEFPDIDLGILDRLDSVFVYGLWEFVTKPSLSFELEVELHFNRYNYELVLNMATCSYRKVIRYSYEDSFTKEKQVDCIHEIGRLIVDAVKDEFPPK
ncbi:hypothetical protein [Aureispira anguillae]|uniref:Uncharacterized protein n=1 Tax=Aureispira anguillae TaxID=2864201 RepID=A0A915YFG9_9BACT|nr:hypothetical protein [Aureispira anguillae]BDS12064.1 hypothetical protein AsAng_0027790 [Aureispira anguillae]